MKLQNIGETLILSIADDTWNFLQQIGIHRKMMLSVFLYEKNM